MEYLDKYPNSIKKAVRYIKQDAPMEQLEEIQRLIQYAIRRRMLLLNKKNVNHQVKG